MPNFPIGAESAPEKEATYGDEDCEDGLLRITPGRTTRQSTAMRPQPWTRPRRP